MIIKIREAENYKDSENEVTIQGWVQNCRTQKNITFLELRDGTQHQFFQVVFKKELSDSLKSESICVETSISVTGLIKTNKNAKGSLEMHASSFEIIGKSSPEYNTIKNECSTSYNLRLTRHLNLRDPIPQKLIHLRSKITQCFREFFFSRNLTEVFPPTIVMNQVEGGSNLFKLDYFGDSAYLTQSSQLYLESAVPAVGDCFTLTNSYRAEVSRTRRHLSEFLHCETELAFKDFEGLLEFVEDTFIEVTKLAIEKYGKEIEELNLGFCERFLSFIEKGKSGKKEKILKRMTHSEAIEFCNENGILNDEGKPFVEGEDISESPERKMVEMIGEPLLLTKFPVEQKPFYMKKCKDDSKLTESVDLLLPGVGEVLGGSVRENDYNKLLEGFERENLDSQTYEWYLDLRKFGTANSVGYGLGMERYLCWILNQENVRKVVLYPRYVGNCYP